MYSKIATLLIIGLLAGCNSDVSGLDTSCVQGA